MKLKFILWLGKAMKGLEAGIEQKNMTKVQTWAGEIKAIANENLKGNVSGWYDIAARADWLKGVAGSVLSGEDIHETTEEDWTHYKNDQEELTNIIEETIGEM